MSKHIWRVSIIAFVSAVIYAGWMSLRQADETTIVVNRFAAKENPIEKSPASGRYMFNVTLHTPEEIQGMLQRADELAAKEQPVRPETGIALVLHGPEIQLFTKQNYEANRSLIELARRLDRAGIIEIKMCRTAMRNLQVKESDVPDFIGFVPYAPDEIKRLEAEGYVYL